jgi:hypothetical protein
MQMFLWALGLSLVFARFFQRNSGRIVGVTPVNSSCG